MALKNHLKFLLCKSLPEQVQVNRFSEHWTFFELENEATHLGKYVPENISRDGLTDLCSGTNFSQG